MARTIVIVPVFWGKAWLPRNGPIPWTDVDTDIRTVAGSYYLAGLADQGLAANATVQPAVVVQAAQDKIPNPFKEDDVWGFPDGLIDDGTVAALSNCFVESKALVSRGTGSGLRVASERLPGFPKSVLRYGQTLNRGLVRCASRRNGFRCVSKLSGHGFVLSREQQRVFSTR